MKALSVFSEFFTEFLQHNHITIIIIVAVLFITIMFAVLSHQFKTISINFKEIKKNFKEIKKNFKELKVQNQHMKKNINTIVEHLDLVTNILCKPLRELELRDSNLWSPPQISSGKSIASTESDSVQVSKTEHNAHNTRSQNDRKLLLDGLNIDEIQCMVTGIKEEVIYNDKGPVGNRVQLAHLIPHNCKNIRRHGMLQKCGLKPEDIEVTRNFLFLAGPIEKAFDNLELSLVRDGIEESSIFRLRIFNEKCKNTPIHEGSNDIIGNYDGKIVNFYGHRVFQTALSLHAQQAYAHNGSKGVSPKIFVSPPKGITSLDILKLSQFSLSTTIHRDDQADEHDDTNSTVVSDLDDDD